MKNNKNKINVNITKIIIDAFFLARINEASAFFYYYKKCMCHMINAMFLYYYLILFFITM